MKKIQFLLTSITLAFLPLVSHGGADDGLLVANNDLSQAFLAITTFLNNVLVPFLLAIGFFVFVWGVIKYFVIGGDNDDAKASGKSLIIYAIAGFVVILAFWGIVNIISNGIGLENQQLTDTPRVIVPIDTTN